jgi:hypothetical protein
VTTGCPAGAASTEQIFDLRSGAERLAAGNPVFLIEKNGILFSEIKENED